jgi:pre-mRNA-processing factor 6
MVFRKPNFGPPPEGYIAGLGRGAVGFVTRGDIGTARIGESTFGGQQLNAPPPGLTRKPPTEIATESTNNYDEWSGYGGALFAGLKED